MTSHDRQSRGGSGGDRLLPGSASLAVLLIVFITLAVLTLFAIMRGGAGQVASDAGGTKAYGPADFAEIDFDRELLPEVEAAGSSDPDGIYRVRQSLAYEDYFPCTDCHADMEVNLERRQLEEMHDDIELDHGPEDRWCFDCHNPDDRDSLRLANGTLIGFDESYRLCGQCHGTIFRDWREGIHGRREGYWNGAKSLSVCARIATTPTRPVSRPSSPCRRRYGRSSCGSRRRRSTMSDADHDRATAGDGFDRSTDRRSLLISTGLTAMAAVSASVAGASTGFVERMLRTRFTELSPERKAEILADLEREYSAALRPRGDGRRHAAPGRGGVCLRPRHRALRRLPALRLRLCA